jgi:hypothetical protein
MWNELKLLILVVFLIALASGLLQGFKHLSPTRPVTVPITSPTAASSTPTMPPVPAPPTSTSTTSPATSPTPVSPSSGSHDEEVSGGVMGVVTIGPTCPVMRNPPEPECADKPYETSLVISSSITGKTVATVRTDADGRYSQELPKGTYVIKAASDVMPPRLQPATFVVDDDIVTVLNLSFDSGIR